MSQPLEALCKAAACLAAGGPLQPIFETILDESIAVTQAERGFVIMASHEEGDLALQDRCGRDQEGATIPMPPQGVSRSTIEEVLNTGRIILTYDAPSDPTMDMRKSVRMLGLRSLVCAPVRLGDQVVGVIYLDSTEVGIFRESDLPTIGALADLASVALELDGLRPGGSQPARRPFQPPRVMPLPPGASSVKPPAPR